ncbi:MAG: 4Fe-4S binding protein [Lachnospiraceae bacterium]|nr:4Fe-4S binding protein [Lachnospiraceae bacterium]
MNIKKIFGDMKYSFPFMGEVRITSVDGRSDALAGLYADENGITLIIDDESCRNLIGKEAVISGIRGAEDMASFALSIRTVLSGEKDAMGFRVDRGKVITNSTNIMPPIRREVILEGNEYRSAEFVVDTDRCTGCKMCITACPSKAIKSQLDMGRQMVTPNFFKARKMESDPPAEGKAQMTPQQSAMDLAMMRRLAAGKPPVDAEACERPPMGRPPMAMASTDMLTMDMSPIGDASMPGTGRVPAAVPDKNGKLGSPVVIVMSQCIRCGECIRVCAEGAISTR